METRLTSKNKEASKQVLVKENNGPGGGGGEVEDTLEIPDPGGAAGSAEPLLLLSLPPASKVWGWGPRGARGAPAPREAQPGRVPPPGPSAAEARHRAPGRAVLGGAGDSTETPCVPVPPRKKKAVDTSAPGPGRARRLRALPRPSAPRLRLPLRTAPRRSAGRSGRGGWVGVLPRDGGSRPGVPAPLGPARPGRGGPGGGSRQHPCSGQGGAAPGVPRPFARPEGAALPGTEPLRPPRGRPGPRCPARSPPVGAAACPAAAPSPAARNSRSRQSREDLSTIRNHSECKCSLPAVNGLNCD
ncbi:uncharacterized protein LJ206_008839 isoform 1-T3 [Theristicus caerulescens]